MKIITKEMLIDYLGGSSMGEEGQPDLIEMLLDLLNPTDDDCCVEGHRKCILEWTREEPEPVLPDGLQKYIDGVGLNILYSNYHKSTNGIWSRAEIDEKMGDGWMGQDEYYVVNIDFGCQDDTCNEQYRERMDVWRDKETGEWTCSDSPKEDPADRDDRLYHEEQDHIAMEKAKETK